MDGPGFSTERSEQYAQDPSRSATLDMPGRKKGRVPFADPEGDEDAQVALLAGSAPDDGRVAYVKTVRPTEQGPPGYGDDPGELRGFTAEGVPYGHHGMGPDGRPYGIGRDGSPYGIGPDGRPYMGVSPEGRFLGQHGIGPDGNPYGIDKEGRPYGIGPNGRPYGGYASDGRPYGQHGISPDGKPYGLAPDGQPYGTHPDGRPYRQDDFLYTTDASLPGQHGFGPDGKPYGIGPDCRPYGVGPNGRLYGVGPDGRPYGQHGLGANGRPYGMAPDGSPFGVAPDGHTYAQDDMQYTRDARLYGQHGIGPDQLPYGVCPDGRTYGTGPDGRPYGGQDNILYTTDPSLAATPGGVVMGSDGQQRDQHGNIVVTKNVYITATGDVPPDQEDLLRRMGQEGISQDGEWTSTKTTTTTTKRTIIKGGESSVHTEYKTEKDGIVETRVEHRTTITSDGEDIDHDAALAAAIRSVTDMNPDLSVEKIEIQTKSETQAD